MTKSSNPPNDPAFQEWEEGVTGRRSPSNGTGFTPQEAVNTAALRARAAPLADEPTELDMERSWRSFRKAVADRRKLDYRSETLTLLAAADNADRRPAQVTTAGGFELSFNYKNAAEGSGFITVLVRCMAPELISRIAGKTVVLCAGDERFVSSPFNPDGEALISLPASVELSDGLTFESPDPS